MRNSRRRGNVRFTPFHCVTVPDLRPVSPKFHRLRILFLIISDCHNERITRLVGVFLAKTLRYERV